ncbi:hypothetical protein [Alteribacter keqinensis]|uniref:Uncharacterized protein n=1 Tax=Alteribacter keqinensis TaxID=2483800 RepID=A0A3M7TVW3_9BACI|nr:hypothetical protein [Alteribacter keqinensis]RNA68535.1 hypothetical protein EBO34_00750 [Alteribacter keqinensis]
MLRISDIIPFDWKTPMEPGLKTLVIFYKVSKELKLTGVSEVYGELSCVYADFRAIYGELSCVYADFPGIYAELLLV